MRIAEEENNIAHKMYLNYTYRRKRTANAVLFLHIHKMNEELREKSDKKS